MKERAVVVGASLAGLRTAEWLRRFGHDGPLVLIGAEAHMPYDRPPLSKQVLTGKAGREHLDLTIEAGFEAEWRLGVAAVTLDVDAKLVHLDDGDAVPFDRLVLATGAHPRRFDWAPAGPGVHYLRTAEDALALRRDLVEAGHVAVIGAGFIGLEVAASARTLEKPVTVIEALAVPLERAIGADMGAAIADMHRRQGVSLRLGVGVDGLVGGVGSKVEGVRMADGTVVDADVVVVGVGVSPATEWLYGSGLDLHDGVVCDDRLRVLQGGRPRADIVAVGDVARWHHPGYGRDVRVEHWTNAAEQGETAARALLEGDGAAPFAPTPYFWSDQYGGKIQFVGETRPGDTVHVLEGEPGADRFLVAYGRDGRLVAGLGLRRPARVMALQAQIAAGNPVPSPEPE